MPQFRKKPVVIEARQWHGDASKQWQEMYDFCREPSGVSCLTGPHPIKDNYLSRVSITTLEGVMFAEPGDWIIKGVKGEFYPCKPDIFEATYDEA